MKNTYSSFQAINKISASTKQFFISIILIAPFFFNNAFGAVSITAPTLSITTCTFPSTPVTLGNIVISENLAGDINGFGTIVLSAPANFEFISPGTVSLSGLDITSANATLTNPTTITLTINISGTTYIDNITMSGIQVKAINTASGPSNVTRTGGTASISGLPNGAILATLSSLLNSVTGGTVSAPQTICKGGDPLAFTENIAATGSGVLTYKWMHSTDSFSASIGTNTTYDVPAGLNSTTTYVRMAMSLLNGINCSANTNNIVVTINDVNGGYLYGDQTICSGDDPIAFTETTASTGSGTLSYEWKYSTDGYSATLATTASYDVPAGLTATTTYRRITSSTLGGVSCTANSNDIIISVISVNGGTISSPQTLCSGSTPASLSGGTPSGGDGSYTYLWQSSTVSPTTGFTAAATYTINMSYSPPTLAATTWYRRIVTSAGCKSNDTSAIEMTVPLPTVTNAPTYTTCSGTTMNIGLTSNIPSTFSWTIGTITGSITGATLGTGNSIIQTLTNPNNSSPGTVQYIITPTSTSGSCPGPSFTITVTVNPSPSVTNAASADTCSETSPTIALTASIASTFSWTIGTITGGITGASNGSGNTINQTLANPNPAAGTVQYLVTPTSSDFCVGSAFTITVTVYPKPVLNNIPAGILCSGTLFSYLPTSSTTGATFDWTRAEVPGISNPTSNGVNDPNEILIDTTASPVNVNYDFTTAANGCSNTETIVVTVNPAPLITNNSDDTICSGTGPNITLTANMASTFAWTIGEISGGITGASNGFGSILNQALTNPDNTMCGSVQYQVTATSTSGSCSGNVFSIWVLVHPSPLANAGIDKTICSDSSVTIGGSPTATGGTAPYTYAWSPSTGLDSLTVSNPTANPSITTTYTITVTDSIGCSSATDGVLITVNPAPIVNAGSDVSICIGESTILTASGNASNYSWNNNISDGVSFTPTNTASYIVTGTTNGCSKSDTVLVSVDSLPTVSAGSPVTICAGQSTTLTASGNATTYSWNNGISDGVAFTPTNTTSYIVTGTKNGCSQNDTVLVTVDSLPIVSAGSPVTICAGQSTTLTASGNATTYSWNNGISDGVSFAPTNTTSYIVTGTKNGCSQNDTVLVTVDSLPNVSAGSDFSSCIGQNTTLTASGNATSYSWNNGISDGVSFIPTNTTSYIVTGTKNGCSQNDTVLITVNPLPIVNANSSASSVCAGGSVTLTGSGTASVYMWSDGVIDGTGFVPDSTTTFIVTGTDGNNCSDTATILLTVSPSPIANAGADFVICIGDTASLSGTGGVSYLWTDGSTTFTSSTIAVNPNVSTVYSLTVTDNSGCTASDTAMVVVTPSKDIYGHVSYSGGNVTNGMAVLYKYEQSQTRFDSIQVKPLDSSGNYLFDSINQGQYLVKVFVDSASYPMLINTYYGNAFLWDDNAVITINHTCNVNDTINNITMVELTGTGGGPGLIIGQIIEGQSFGRVEGEPIPGVDVKLGKNPGGSIIATTSTDSTGHFTFSGVEYGNYTIYVDIPGLGRDSTYTFTVDSVNNQFLNQNYIADSTSVYINPTSTVGINNATKISENKIIVYPNPVKGNTTIEYTIAEMTDSKITLEVYTILGEKISSLVNATQQAGIYKYNFNPQSHNLNSGVYFISLCINGQTSTKRIVIME